MSADNTSATPPAAKPKAFVSAVVVLLLPLAAFALAWVIAGKIPIAVSTQEWGTWFFIGPLLGIAGIAGIVFACMALVRGDQRTLAAAAFILNAVALLIAWAGLFA